jgi:membrane-associated protease RseP (regulator of RpoE activity)
VSTNGHPIGQSSGFPPGSVIDSGYFEALAAARARPHHRYWLHALLLLATLLTTTVVGAGLARAFAAGIPFDYDPTAGYRLMWRDPSYLLQGLPFSFTLLLILMAHEMGHYLAARYYHVDATLPFFLPAPTLIGTFGAFIRIRSPIIARRILFDIGIGGPLAGFAMLIIPMIIGVTYSRIIPGIGTRGELIYGTPLIVRLFEAIIYPGVSPNDIYLHPIARAAWVGVLATALNLLPIGQLDGGHILYSFLGEKTRILSRIFAALLGGLGATQLFTSDYKWGYLWLFWAAFLFLFGMRHPTIIDPSPLSRTRRWLGFLALIIFILSFTPAPVRTA